MFFSNRLPENLKSYRKAANLSQSELAEMLKISPQSISKWETGAALPDIEKLCLLSEIFNVSIDNLIGHSNEQKKFMIAVDGGGTKTEFIMFSEDGTIIEQLKLDGCNPNTVGMERCFEILTSGIDSLLFFSQNVYAIYVGAAGFWLGNKSAKITKMLTKKYPNIKIKCANDIFNVIASAETEEDCIAVICGTGTAILLKQGETLTSLAGWGYLISKWGSGFDIGRDGIYAALAESEKLGKKTKITDLLKNRYEKSPYEILEEVYKQPPSYIASFATIVFEAHRMGDEVATQILEENAQKLAQYINKAHKEYDSGNKVILSGSLFTKDNIFSNILSTYLDSKLKTVVPIYPQIYGACALCVEMCGLDRTALRDKFMQQYNKIKK